MAPFLVPLLLTVSLVAGTRLSGPRVSVVVVGGLGDLAARKLWPSLFALHRDGEADFAAATFFAAGRIPQSEGEAALTALLQRHLACEPGDAACGEARATFVSRVHYAQAVSDADYAQLSSRMAALAGGKGEERGRLFYLATPPTAFGPVAGLIHRSARAPGRAWTKIVLEKPIGHDLASARALLDEVGRFFPAEDQLLVDHYLAKAGLRAAAAFMQHTVAADGDADGSADAYADEGPGGGWASLLDAAGTHLLSVRAELTETLDVRGRTGFYEGVGAVRDVLQNHVTEMAASVLARPDPGESWAAARQRALSGIQPAAPSQVLLGQYRGYRDHVCEDAGESPGCDAGAAAEATPTFAAALTAWVPGPQDPGAAPVPLVLSTAKRVEQEAGGAAFVELRLCTQPANRAGAARSCDEGEEVGLRFNVHGGDGLGAGVLLASAAAPPLPPLPGYREPSLRASVDMGFQHVMRPASSPPPAYVELLRAAVRGGGDAFVSPPEVLDLWRIWDPIACRGDHCEAAEGQSVAPPRVYSSYGDVAFHWYVDQRGQGLITFDNP